MRTILVVWLLVSGCEDPLRRGPVTAEDQPHADVFKSLDGEWTGVFYRYEDTLFLTHPSSPDDLSDWSGKVLRDSLTVIQVYVSESPYFQRVTITDKYQDRDEVSVGVNKVEAGELWCIVKKPDEWIRHKGRRVGTNTIVWTRDERSPLKKEYFYETVTDSSYTIVGWGYYGEDDVDRGPRTWFKATYR